MDGVAKWTGNFLCNDPCVIVGMPDGSTLWAMKGLNHLLTSVTVVTRYKAVCIVRAFVYRFENCFVEALRIARARFVLKKPKP